MFREEYRKANESIHAPEHLLDSIKNDLSLSTVPKRRNGIHWPGIMVYSGCAVAVAALALLIFRPFSFLRPEPTAFTAMEAKVPVSETGVNEQMQLFSAGSTEERPMLFVPAAGEPAESASQFDSETSDRAERTDGDEDEYYIFNTPIETTYDEIFHMLMPQQQNATEETQKKSTITEFASSDVEIIDNQLNAFGTTFDLKEGRSVRALVEAWDCIYVISEDNGFVITSVYNKAGLVGETKQSGTYISYELKETTVFDDDYSLSEHRIIMITSQFVPELHNADIQVPSSFVPVYSDSLTERPLLPEEITCVNESDSYMVYGAVEASGNVKMLYIFAELG